MSILYKGSFVIYFCLYRLLNYRKRVTIQNISRSFPDKKYNEIESIVRDFYMNFADLFVEVLKSISISSKELNRKLTIEGFEFVENQMQNGKSTIACLGHCGNWEILNCLPAKIEINIYSGYKPIKASLINKLMFDVRSRFGMHLIPSQSVAKHILSNKNNPSLYLFLADQCPKKVNSNYQFTFLNQETSVLSGPEKLARATGSAIVYIKLIRTQKGHFKAECQPICENANNMQELEITKKYLELLEQNIEEDPSGWLWTHKRWKR
jgi:Kdo2-lipid IVA lauroyltransferase/acyltransferase